MSSGYEEAVGRPYTARWFDPETGTKTTNDIARSREEFRQSRNLCLLRPSHLYYWSAQRSRETAVREPGAYACYHANGEVLYAGSGQFGSGLNPTEQLASTMRWRRPPSVDMRGHRPGWDAMTANRQIAGRRHPLTVVVSEAPRQQASAIGLFGDKIRRKSSQSVRDAGVAGSNPYHSNQKIAIFLFLIAATVDKAARHHR
jgi:hypothetical protein